MSIMSSFRRITASSRHLLDLALACAILIADDQIRFQKIWKILQSWGLNLSEVVAIKGVYAMLQQPKTRFWILPKMTKMN